MALLDPSSLERMLDQYSVSELAGVIAFLEEKYNVCERRIERVNDSRSPSGLRDIEIEEYRQDAQTEAKLLHAIFKQLLSYRLARQAQQQRLF